MPEFFRQYLPAMRTVHYFRAHFFHLLPNLLFERKKREVAAKKRMERYYPLFLWCPNPFPGATFSSVICSE
jgi:hypothetical protein